MYYDYLSAFCKSLRGSDADAGLYYAFRLIKAGIDPQIIVRRMIAHASEDIGMADSNALLNPFFENFFLIKFFSRPFSLGT